MRKLVSAALCAALLVAAGGCGSSNDSSSTTVQPAATNPLPTSTAKAAKPAASAEATHKAFLKRVNPICADYNREVRTVQADLQAVGKSGNVDVYAPPLKRATAAAKRASKRFSALKAPPAEAAQAALIGRALNAQATGNALLLKAARADDPQAFGVATQALQRVTPQLQSLMRDYGMTVCGAAG